MKRIIIFGILLGFLSCSQQAEKIQDLQTRIDTLESIIDNSYKPGFGDFMSNFQAHHAKLWFAGQNKNWRLADFEVHEIKETIEDIQKYKSDRRESLMIGMINPALDSINLAIDLKKPDFFNASFILLTKACNSCHQATGVEFNVVKIPDSQIFSNQDFKTY